MHFPNGSALLSQSGTTLLRNNTPSLTLPALETQELGWESYLVRVVAAIGLTIFARWMYQSARFRWGPVNINAHGWWFFHNAYYVFPIPDSWIQNALSHGAGCIISNSWLDDAMTVSYPVPYIHFTIPFVAFLYKRLDFLHHTSRLTECIR